MRRATLSLVLAHCANPDVRGGYWTGRPPTSGKPRRVAVADLADARAKFLAWIAANGLGGGNLDVYRNGCGNVLDVAGKIIARVAYNGRVFAAEAPAGFVPKHAGQTPEIILDGAVRS